MEKQFRRILDLIRRTGDRMIVTDSDGENVYVIMDLEAYEAIIDMEDQVFDAIMEEEGAREETKGKTHDNPPVRDESASATKENGQSEPRVWDHMAPAGSDAETWDLNKLSPDELADLERHFNDLSNKAKEIAQKDAATESKPVEQSGTKKDDEDEFGEEQFYLEPIE